MNGQPKDIIDLFSGPRGWSEGLRMLALSDIGLELDRDAARTSQAAGHTTIQCDVTQYPTAPFKRGRSPKVIASPVCTPFSRAGKQAGLVDLPLVYQAVHDLASGRDTRSKLKRACTDAKSVLAAEPMRWLYDLRPEWVCMEQVPDVLPLWKQYAAVLHGWGYSTWTGILNAADYGVPQTRRRAILIASCTRAVSAPAPTHGQNTDLDLFGNTYLPWVTMSQALGWEPGLEINTRGARRTSGGNNFPCDEPSWALTEKARSWWVLRHSKRSNATVRRVDQPAATLVAGHARHDYQWVRVDGRTDLEKRPLLLSEAAVLQGFRPGHPFHGSESKRFLQIANAVPPLLAAHVVSTATGIPMLTAEPAAAA
ncbi:DNA cytosine methyltransferase [Streptomyces sp. NPDC006627]|uniref:DNA cytosine methyltransferase n=1 Tax=Streptomyces sp. NPDC006627 TaxID=3154679 RepID=UPI0033B22B56